MSYSIGHEPSLIPPLETVAADPVCEQCDKYADRRHDGLCDRCAGICETCGKNDATLRYYDASGYCETCADKQDERSAFTEIVK